ncbi:MAG: T9SS type A sorting domain-containing protein [candidate division KSB1 bacterium]|nr:T9SS type A sorting domain-containing protein [candidate division KSB1 bacterium]
MKLMRYTLWACLLMASVSLFSQTVYSRIDYLRLSQDEFAWDIQIKRTDDWSVQALGHYDFYFYVNSDAFSSIDPMIEWVHPNLDGNASYNITTGYAADESFFWVSLDYVDSAEGTDFYPSDPDQYTAIIKVALPFIDSPDGQTGVDWHTLSTAGTDGELNPLTQTLEGSGDITIDIQLASLQADIEGNQVCVHWRTESERSVLGYQLYKKKEAKEIYQRVSETLISATGNATTPAEYSFVDTNVEANTAYTYKLSQVTVDGGESKVGTVNVRTDAWLPEQYFLETNYPNPFNPSTSIKFGLPKQSFVRLDVYNIRGELICTLADDQMSAGVHVVQWGGRDTAGIPVSSGVYFYKLKAGNFEKIFKMLLAK